MNLRETVLKILAGYGENKYVVGQVITDKLVKSAEMKSIIDEMKKPRLQGGQGWSNEKVTEFLQREYRIQVTTSLCHLRMRGLVETVDISKNLNVVYSSTKTSVKKELVAHKITKVGLDWLSGTK